MNAKLRIVVLLLAVSSSALLPFTASAQVNININLGEAPPPLRFESIPASRDGYLWAPGYWNWDGSRHVWSAGHWERVRRDEDYVRPEWRQENGKWHLVQGGWKKNHHKHKEKDRDDNNDRHGDRRGDDEGQKRGGGEHCPPGQAKKGNC